MNFRPSRILKMYQQNEPEQHAKTKQKRKKRALKRKKMCMHVRSVVKTTTLNGYCYAISATKVTKEIHNLFKKTTAHPPNFDSFQ